MFCAGPGLFQSAPDREAGRCRVVDGDDDGAAVVSIRARP